MVEPFGTHEAATSTYEATLPVNQVNISKRNFIKGGTIVGLGLLAGGTATLASCGKSVVFYVTTVIGSLDALKPLLPNLSPQIDKAIAIAKAFNEAYQAGKFANAAAIYANLVDVVDQIVAAAGVMNPQVTRIVALGGVALRFIGAILDDQASEPTVAAVVASMNSPEQQRQKTTIKRMANPQVFQQIAATVRP